MLAEVDRKTVARGLEPGEQTFVVSSEWQPIRTRFTIQGYEMDVTEGDGGRRRVRPTDVERTYRDVPYYADYVPTRTVRLPRGYVITVHDQPVLDKLMAHGVTVERVKEPARAMVETFTVRDVERETRWNQGHFPSRAQG